MEKLLVHPAPKTYESLSGYMLRLSELNGLRGPADIFSLAGIELQNLSMLASLQIFDKTTTYLKQLAMVTGRNVSDLEGLTYRLPLSVTKPTYVRWGSQQMPLLALRRTSTCVCPECLIADPYIRQAWDWSIVPICREHRRLLLSECPKCQNLVSRARHEVCKCNCNFDFREAAQCQEQGAFENLKLIIPEVTQDTNHNYEWLHAWTTLAAISADIGALTPDLKKFSQIGTRCQHDHLMRTLEIWADGRAIEYARYCLKKRAALIGVLGPRSALLPFYQNRKVLQLGFGFGFGLVEFEKVILKTCETECTHDEDVSSPVINGEEKLRCDDVSFLLNINSRVVAASVKYGALKPVRGPSVDGFGGWVFSATDVAELIRSLNPKPCGTGSAFNFLDANRPGGIDGVVGTARLLGELRSGKFLVVSFNQALGLSSMRLKSTISPRPEKVEESLKVTDIAKRLEIYTDAIYRLIKAKILVAHKVGRSFRVTSEEFESFVKTYVFVRELAKKLHANPTNLAEKLMAFGAKPVSGPNIDGALIYLFARADLAELDLCAVAKVDTYPTRTGRKKASETRSRTTFISSTEVADQLGITVQRLACLVRERFIRESKSKLIRRNGRYFRRSEVERYLREFRNNTKFVPVEKAVNQLGVSWRYIWQRWVKNNAVNVFDDGLQRYLRVDDVRKIEEERKELLTSSEAAELLGIGRATLQNWLNAGVITVLSTPEDNTSGLRLFTREGLVGARARLEVLKG